MMLEESLSARIGEVPALQRMLAEDDGWSMRLVELPGITLQIVVDLRPQTFKGFQRVRQTAVQVDAWAQTKPQAATLRNDLIGLLVGPALVGDVQFQRAMISAVRTMSVPEQSAERQRYRGRVARESINFIFTHNAT